MKLDEIKGKLNKEELQNAFSGDNMSKKGLIVAAIAAVLIFGAILGSLGNKRKPGDTGEHQATGGHEQTEAIVAADDKKHEPAVERHFEVVEKKEQKELKAEKAETSHAEKSKHQDVVVKHAEPAAKEKTAEVSHAVAPKKHEKPAKAATGDGIKYTYVDTQQVQTAAKPVKKGVAVPPVKKIDAKTRQELENLRRTKEELQAELSKAKAAVKKKEVKGKAHQSPAKKKSSPVMAGPAVAAPALLPMDKIQELLAKQQKMIRELRQKEKVLKGLVEERRKTTLELAKVVEKPEKQPQVKKTTEKVEAAVPVSHGVKAPAAKAVVTPPKGRQEKKQEHGGAETKKEKVETPAVAPSHPNTEKKVAAPAEKPASAHGEKASGETHEKAQQH